MAYDPDLAARVRDELGGTDVREQRMFGGLAFLVGGHMAVAASGDGLMVRCEHDATETLLERPGAAPMVMRGREMPGWLRVGPSGLSTDHALADWVAIGTAYAGSLPPR